MPQQTLSDDMLAAVVADDVEVVALLECGHDVNAGKRTRRDIF